HRRAALRADRRAVVRLALNRTGDLHWLDFGFERPREGTLHHAFEPSLEALQHSHGYLLPLLASDGIGGEGPHEDVVTSLVSPGGGGTADAPGSRPRVPAGVRGQNPPRPPARACCFAAFWGAAWGGS